GRATLYGDTDELDSARRHSRRNQGRERGGGPRHRDDLVSCRDRGGDELLAAIRKARRTGVGHERDVPATVHLTDQLSGLATMVELGVARQMLRPNLVLAEEDLGVARVLTRDHVHFLEDSQSAQRDILEITDRCRHEKELAYGRTVARRRSPSRPQLTMRLGRTRRIAGS